MHEIKPTGIYSADEIAEIFDTTKRYVWNTLSSGELIGRKVSRRWYSTGAALLTFLEYPPPQNLPGKQSTTEKSAIGPKSENNAPIEQQSSVPNRVDAAKLVRTTNNHLFSIQNAIEKAAAGEGVDNSYKTLSETPTSPVIEQIEREAAISKAWQDSGYSVEGTVNLLNQQMQSGGPKPEQDRTWTQKNVDQMVTHLGLLQK